MPPKLDKALLFPSPNWFQASGCKATIDGWLVYTGPNKSLCILIPILADEDQQVVGNPEEPSYHAYVVQKAHEEKLVSVDVSLEWLTKRMILSGSADGAVKLWNVDYEDNKISVKHILTHDVHSRDKEEVVSVGFSTSQFAITVSVCGTFVKWNITSNVTVVHRKLCHNLRPQCMACSPHLPLHVAVGTKQGVILLFNLTDKGQIVYKVRGHNDEVMNINWCPQYEVLVNKSVQETLSMRLNKVRNTRDPDYSSEATCDAAVDRSKCNEEVKQSDDSQPNESEIVEEEDLFDVYKDHEHEEFGHKKFVPQDIVVKVDEDKSKCDYLEECQKLKDDIMKIKNEPEPSIEELVEALNKSSVSVDGVKETKEHFNTKEQPDSNETQKKHTNQERENSLFGQKTVHVQKHMLVSISKNGYIQTWSKSGKQVGCCTLLHPGNKNKNKPKSSSYVTVFWHKPDTLLASDYKNNIQLINPFELDAKNGMLYKPVHNIHKRLPYCIVSGAPRVQAETDHKDYPVWSASQDRMLVQYSLQQNKPLLVNSTCGAFIYSVAFCPYDAGRVAASGGDGAVRVISEHGSASYWQNLQGKVLTLAWHPTRENLLAFGTAEARLGTLKAADKADRPAKLLPAAGGAVYGLCWSPGALYACAGGELLRYQHGGGAPEVIPVEIEGVSWHIADVRWSPRALLVGGVHGGACVMTAAYPHTVVAAAFPSDKVIHCMDWHPQQVSSADTESALQDLIAVSSYEKNIAILKLVTNEGGETNLVPVTSLTGHRQVVYTVQWSPHYEDMLLSTSQDSTVRIWQTLCGACTHVFPSAGAVLCAAWGSAAGTCVLSGGADCTLRLWDAAHYPKELYIEEPVKKQRNKRQGRADTATPADPEPAAASAAPVAAELDRLAHSKKFLLPLCQKEITAESLNACKKFLQKYIAEKQGTADEEIPKEKTTADVTSEKPANKETSNQESDDEEIERDNDKKVNEEDYNTNYIKMFGNINDVNELLDMEQARHESVLNHEAWLMVAMVRGRVTDMVQYAANRHILSPFLVALAPAVSYKYWKEVTELYINQIERLYAERQESKLYEGGRYGGPVFQRAALQLATSDIRGAVTTLSDAGLHKEAYVLTRARHCPDLAEHVLREWRPRVPVTAAHVIDMALGNLADAATTLAKSKKPESLSLAIQIAQTAGQATLAHSIAERLQLIQHNATPTEEVLAELPTRLGLMLNLNSESISSTEIDKEENTCRSVKELTDPNKTEEVSYQNGKQKNLGAKDQNEFCGKNDDVSNHTVNGENKSSGQNGDVKPAETTNDRIGLY